MSSKILKPIAIGAGIIAIGIATGGIGIAPGLAATSMTGAVGAMLTTTTVGGALLAAGASSIMAGVSAGLQKGPKTAGLSAIERLNASVNPSAPRKVVFGFTAMGTDIRYVEPSGANQEYIDYIVAVAAHAVHSIEQLWLEDTLVWTGSGGVGPSHAGYLWIKPVLEGRADNTVAINGGAKWGASRRLTGCAYVHIRIKRTGNSKKAQSPFASAGLPSRMTIVGKGLKLYDPRRDSTVPGGSGPMRIGDQSTWRFQADDGITIGQNTALQALAYQIGWRINGKLSVGRGIPAQRIDLQSYITAANLCEEGIARADGLVEQRYLTNGVFSEDDDPGGVLDALALSANSVVRDASGRLAWEVRHNDLAAPLVALDDDDVLSGFTWDPVPKIEQTYNVVRGRYCDPSANSLYQLVDYPEVRIPNVDGIDRVMALDLPLVDGIARAQRIAKQALQRQQYRGTFAADFGARAWNAQVGDVVTLTFSALGWVNKLFRITDQAIRIDGTCPMTLEEENAQIYAWDREDSAGVRAGAPNVYDPRNNPLILAVDDAALSADWPRVGDPDGTKPEDNATNSADPDSAFGPGGTVADALAQFAEFDATVARLQADIDAAIGPVADQLRADLQAARDRIEAVKTQLELSDTAIRQEIAKIEVGDASGAVAEIRDQVAALVTAADALAGRVATVEATFGDFDARIRGASTVATNASSAVASLQSSVTTSFAGVNTRITNEANASVQRDDGIASQVSSLSGSIGGVYGEISRQASLSVSRDNSLTQRIDSQESSLGNLSGSISSVQRTLSTQGQAIATLNTSVAASSAPNLLTNGAFTNGTNNWYLYQTNGNWDVQPNSNGYNFAQHYFNANEDTGFYQNVYNIQPGAKYSLSMEQEHDRGCYGHCTIQWWTEGFGRLIDYGGETPENVSGWGNRANLNGSIAPNDSRGQARCARIQFYPSAGNGTRRISRIMFQRSDVASGYSDAAALDSLGRAVASVQARVDTVQSAVAEATGRTRAYARIAAIAGDQRAELEFLAQDGNGNPISAIRFTGNYEFNGAGLFNGSVTFAKAAYGLTGVDSLYYYQTFNDNSQTDFSAGPAGVGITISEGSTVDGRANIAMTNLNGVGRVFVKIIRVNDGTPVWGGQNGIQFNPPGGGDHMMLHIEFADSVPAGTTPQYDVRFRCTGGANIRSSVRVEKLSEKVRTRFSQIWIVAPMNEGPGAGSNGGGQINGDASGSGGVSGTSPSGGNSNYGGLRGRTAEP